MSEANGYPHLERRPGSNYQQLFVQGRRIRAEVLYRQTVGVEPRTPEEVARDYDLPVEVVREAIDYCLRNEDELRQDRERELANIRADELLHPPLVPPGSAPES
jgi:uncharacterized protein (DUF433 family)